MKRSGINQGSLAGELARLHGLDRQELVELWRKFYKTEPPFKISGQLMVRAIAYKMQEQVMGGLKLSTHKFLASVIDNIASDKSLPKPPASLKPGTKLIREWHGVTYEVAILEGEILFQGKQYRSLSEVARIITGVRWSGPLFFGLKGKAA